MLQSLDVFSGVSVKGLVVENVAQVSHCARDSNFKHFALLQFLAAAAALLVTVMRCSCEDP